MFGKWIDTAIIQLSVWQGNVWQMDKYSRNNLDGFSLANHG